MKKSLAPILLFAVAGFAAGCSGTDDSADVGAPTKNVAQGDDDLPPGQEAKPFAEFLANGQTIRAYEITPGELVIAEKRDPVKPSVFTGLPEDMSLSEIYSYFNEGPVPQAIIEFEARAADFHQGAGESAPASSTETVGSPQYANDAPGLQLTHEAGSAHFRSDHCPASLSPVLTFPIGTTRPTTATRLFCWAEGFTDAWTESSTAKALTHLVSSVQGDICYTLATAENVSLTFTILNQEMFEFRWANSIYTDSCPPWPFACGPRPPKIREKAMSGTIGCASGDTWRFGGGFWR